MKTKNSRFQASRSILTGDDFSDVFETPGKDDLYKRLGEVDADNGSGTFYGLDPWLFFEDQQAYSVY